jgi:polysaccharide export outer membrane protein
MLKAIHHLLTCLLVALILFSFSSCSAPKSTAYFQTITRDTLLQNTVTKNFDLKIVPDDLLAITIASASPELSGLFNASQGGGTGATSGGASSSAYLVDKKGNIQLYKLGEVKLAGLTRSEAKEKLQRELSPYLKEPVVTIRFANHRVTVLGEVSRPGVLPLATDQVTVLEAIGQSGDLTEFGKRENILVIRQGENGKEFRHLNLLDNSVFASAYYYLQNEDVVYVEPDEKRKNPKNTSQVISYVVSGVSILSLILSRIK